MDKINTNTNAIQKACMYASNISERREKEIGRNIFAGKFLFRGLLTQYLLLEIENARLVEKSVKAFLDEKNLIKLYDSMQLEKIFENMDADKRNSKLKLIYAYLGYISKETGGEKEMLFDNIIGNITKKKDYNYHKSMYDIWQKVKYLAKKNFEFDAYVLTKKNKDNDYITTVALSNELVFEYHADNFKASRKKAFKSSLKYLLELEHAKVEKFLMEKEEERKKKEEALAKALKEERQKQHLEYLALREQERLERKKRFKEKEKVKQIFRIKSKRRKTRRKKLAKQREEEFLKSLENISSSKRRILEDRGILPKKK